MRTTASAAALLCLLPLLFGLAAPEPALAQLTPELPAGIVLSREQARARFGGGAADELLGLYQRFLVLPGPLVLQGNFGDDYRPATSKGSFDCIIVNGDLQVSGRVRFDKPTPGLLVRGNVKARTLENTDSFVRVLGNVEVTQAIIASYSDGSLGIQGSAQAPYLISVGHDWWVRGAKKIGTILDTEDQIFSPDAFESALFDPGTERTLVPEVFDGPDFNVEKFLDRLDRSLPVVRTWTDLHPGYARVRAFVKATADAEPAVVDRETTKLLRELDGVGFDRPIARLLIVQRQCMSRSGAGKNGSAADLARWGECSDALAGLLPAPPAATPYFELTDNQMAVLGVCGTLNEYGWHVFEHAAGGDELQRAVQTMRKTLPWVRPFDNVWNVLDTTVRLLLKTGQRDEAYREVRAALARDGDFADFQDIKRSAEYKAWLRNRK